ncbi:MAG: glutathione S-transferase N-terminal domain-containing protein [Burkholderiaceae bacterium]|nr:glutathione S-transferase N-terminal domain-containing protein [Burkholderiaceae bacterium]
MKLYGLPGACSLVDHITLQWTGQPFEYEIVPRAGLKTAPFTDINPMGAVPVLVDGDVTLTQNVAILEYIAEQYPQANVHGGTTARARAEARRWLALLNSDVHKTFSMLFGATRMVSTEAAQDELRKTASDRIKEMFALINKRLEGREWLGEARSVADAYLYVILRWAGAFKMDLSAFPNLQAHFARMQADKGVQAALAAEGLK